MPNVTKMTEFRITVKLNGFFEDHRRTSRLFLNKNLKTIADLAGYIRGRFNIENEVYLTSDKVYLPEEEDVRVLKEDDVVCVIACSTTDPKKKKKRDKTKRVSINNCLHKKRKEDEVESVESNSHSPPKKKKRKADKEHGEINPYVQIASFKRPHKRSIEPMTISTIPKVVHTIHVHDLPIAQINEFITNKAVPSVIERGGVFNGYEHLTDEHLRRLEQAKIWVDKCSKDSQPDDDTKLVKQSPTPNYESKPSILNGISEPAQENFFNGFVQPDETNFEDANIAASSPILNEQVKTNWESPLNSNEISDTQVFNKGDVSQESSNSMKEHLDRLQQAKLLLMKQIKNSFTNFTVSETETSKLPDTSNDNLEECSDTSNLGVKRKRKRKRQKKKPPAPLSDYDLECVFTKPVVFEQPASNGGSHIRFDGETANLESCNEASDLLKIGDLELQAILKCPVLGETPLKIGDIIAFKMLVLSQSCIPTISNYIVAHITHYESDTKNLAVKVLGGEKCLANDERLMQETVNTEEMQELNLNRLLEVRLLYP